MCVGGREIEFRVGGEGGAGRGVGEGAGRQMRGQADEGAGS